MMIVLGLVIGVAVILVPGCLVWHGRHLCKECGWHCHGALWRQFCPVCGDRLSTSETPMRFSWRTRKWEARQ